MKRTAIKSHARGNQIHSPNMKAKTKKRKRYSATRKQSTKKPEKGGHRAADRITGQSDPHICRIDS